jgi:hypothetical protein
MGRIAQSLTDSKKEITHDELVCAEALTRFYDYDVKNYKLICDYLYLNLKKNPKKREGFGLSYAPIDFCENKGLIKRV